MFGSFGYVFCYSINFLLKFGFFVVFKVILDDLFLIDFVCKLNKNVFFFIFILIVIF